MAALPADWKSIGEGSIPYLSGTGACMRSRQKVEAKTCDTYSCYLSAYQARPLSPSIHSFTSSSITLPGLTHSCMERRARGCRYPTGAQYSQGCAWRRQP